MPVSPLFDLKEPLFPGIHPGDLAVGSAPPAGAQIPFAMQTQEQTMWCWAAIAASVSRHHEPNSEWTQCKIADVAFKVTLCCEDGACRACNRTHAVGAALQITMNLDHFFNRGPTFDEVKAEVASGKPLCGTIRWPVGGHAVVISGYLEEGSSQYVTVDDPLFGQSICELEEFLTNYRLSRGQCTATCLTKQA